jgi:hypothetical protein
MIMKTFLFCFILFLELSFTSFAQALWPICGSSAGEGILYKPQQYIGDELNFDALFLSAAEGTIVVAPIDGVIRNVSILSWNSRSSLKYWDIKIGSINEKIAEIIASHEKVEVPYKYLSGSITIKSSDGNRIRVDGLRGDTIFKTGMIIHKGDTIGTVGYDYKKINVPHIAVSFCSNRMDPIDPMTPFGLQTTFIAPREFITPDTLTSSQALEDIQILFDAYKECYPSLGSILTPGQADAFEAGVMAKLQQEISYIDFFYLVRSSTASDYIHDSHLKVLTHFPNAYGKFLVPHLYAGFLNDSLFVTCVTKDLGKYLRKTITSINGIDAKELIKRAKSMQNLFDEKSCSSRDISGLTAWNYLYGSEVHTLQNQIIVFTDGSEFKDHWIPRNTEERIPTVSNNISYHSNRTKSLQNDYNFERLRNDVVLFSLYTFKLNQTQLEEIADSLQACSSVQNMIIDLRNNPGGDEQVLAELLSYFISKKPVKLDSYQKVNSNGTYHSFKYSTNCPEDAVLFSEFETFNGRDGYYSKNHWLNRIEPNPTINYAGNLYILTGEETVSAATYFPAFLVRNHRAVTVGRETPTGYHYMTANKFVDIRLPNSGIQVRIPLVKEVFDETVNNRVPAGRGLLPDYEIPLSYEEYYISEEDIILSETLDLISEGKYLGKNPFRSQLSIILSPWVISLVVLAILTGIILSRKIVRKG